MPGVAMFVVTADVLRTGAMGAIRSIVSERGDEGEDIVPKLSFDVAVIE